jgi:C-terminal processing protease CtpA/Prc
MRNILFYTVVILFSLNSCIEDPEIHTNDNQGNFDALWQIIDTRYCYLDYKKINWDSVKTVYANRFGKDTPEQDMFYILGDMLNELKDGHVNLYSDFDRSRYWKWFTDYPENFNSDLVFSDRYLGKNYKIAGGFRYEKIAGGKVGYMYYNDFSNVFTDSNLDYIFTYFKDCNALIIDVRGNGGGYLSLAEKLASCFFEQETITGYMQHKTGNGHTDFSDPVALKTPAHKSLQWQRPVAVLSNRHAYSATNSFISRMKQAPHAMVIGDKSGGGGGMPLSSELPNGWMVRFSSSPMFDAGMNHIEWGVDPDVKVDMSNNDQLKGYDTIIEKAITQLLK